MPKYKTLDKRQASRQDTTSPKNIVKGGGTSTTPSKGWVGASRSLLPINAAMFIQDLAGNKTPLTEKDLTPKELDAMRYAGRDAKSTNQPNLTYLNYRQRNTDKAPTLKDRLTIPSEKMKTTIGGAMLQSKGSNTHVIDSYDFAGSGEQEYKDISKKYDDSTVNALTDNSTTTFDKAAFIGRKYGSKKDGKGIPVDINLGNLKRPTKQEEESNTFMKGTKKIKVKKAVNGLQDVDVPKQGSYADIASSTASGASTGAAFGPYGAIIGGAVGAGAGFLQKSQADSANNRALTTNRLRMATRQYAGDEDTINQAPQRFKKGGKVSTKTIEIEGKKTPEIHTDKNFNVKNLGSIPHSKGGNKVEAEGGDIVFNTQNSLTKYNKIASALENGDKTTLNKEKNKLPEDKGMKNQTGNRGVKKRDVMMEEEEREAQGLPKPSYMNKLVTKAVNKSAAKQPSRFDNKVAPSFTGTAKPSPRLNNPTPQPLDLTFKGTGNNEVARRNNPNYVAPITPSQRLVNPLPTFNEGYKLPNGKTGTPIVNKPITKAPINATTSGKSIKKATPISNVLAPAQSPLVNKFNPGTSPDVDLSDLKNTRSLDQVAESARGMTPINSSSKPISSPSTGLSTTQKGQGLNNALQFTGVANNLFQGLKNEPKVDEKYYNPNLIKYNDRSQSLRNQSNQAANAQIATARNLSGGNAGNLRANATAARIDNLNRQGGIDEREQERADAIQSQNTEIKNQADQVNLGRRDNYQQINLATKAAKQAYVDQAASDIGQYGMAKSEENYMRSRDDKAEAAQLAGYKSINGRYQHKSTLNGDTYFEPDADSSITRYGNGLTTPSQARRRKTLGIFKNGTKSVSTKYKMKSIV